MRRLTVIPVALGVLRFDLMQMWQNRGESFRAFAARVRGKADTCAFTVDCTCGLKVCYTDHMIRDTLPKGIVDDEITQEILGSADVLTRVVNEIVALVESKEIARNAVPPTEVTSVSAVQRPHDADHRARRNAISRRESNNLPSRSNNHVVHSASDFISSTRKGSWLEYQTLQHDTRSRDTEDITSLQNQSLHHLTHAYKLLKSSH